jgi:sterol desaturase/sphingolipid hydroxylase (fatty acid hydroxylase superfamily)
MTHYPISHDPEPNRLIESDFLEFFTHITPQAVVVIWLPVVGIFLGRGILAARAGAGSLGTILGGFLLGLFIWTFAEYTLHRFVFHYKPTNPTQERIFFLFHGIHHAQPQCKTRLVMPPVVSVPVSALFYGLFWLIAGQILGARTLVDPLVSGFITGYLIYDLTHYATHHFPMRARGLKFIKRHHMQHHYKTPDQRFGVSSHFWDLVFGTQPSS